ncbi:MAG: PQQ-like beta-propeller repeat protein [Bacteroidales bacterium]|nr:PQQ-like beta-propeller repeat protein [Bacteroidales bacterium]
MLRSLLLKSIIPLFALGASGLLIWWLLHDPVKALKPSVPGMDNRGKGVKASTENIVIGQDFTFFKDCPDIPNTRWTRFRGADFDNISKEKIPLINSWGTKGPKILWKKALGDGHAAPAVYDGRIYLLDYDEKSKSDALRCLSLLTGEELWNRRYKVHLKRNHGLSRTIPAVTEKYVVSIGPRGQVMCVDRKKGDLLWGIDLEKDLGSEVPFWYTGQCPLIDNDTAIIAAAGKALLIAIDCKTGKKVWETPNPSALKMSHSSVMPMTFKGKKMYVYCAIGGICGISASAPDQGKILWESREFSPSVIAPSPLILDNGIILVTAGYGAGSAILQLQEKAGNYTAKVLRKFKPADGIASEQQTPIYSNGFVYAILPKDAGEMRNQFAVYKAENLQKVIGSSGKTVRFGLGPYILADGKFFILNDDGEISIARVENGVFKLLDKARIIDGQDSWGPLVITGGYLLMRDSKQMVCIDIKAN